MSKILKWFSIISCLGFWALTAHSLEPYEIKEIRPITVKGKDLNYLVLEDVDAKFEPEYAFAEIQRRGNPPGKDDRLLSSGVYWLYFEIANTLSSTQVVQLTVYGCQVFTKNQAGQISRLKTKSDEAYNHLKDFEDSELINPRDYTRYNVLALPPDSIISLALKCPERSDPYFEVSDHVAALEASRYKVYLDGLTFGAALFMACVALMTALRNRDRANLSYAGWLLLFAMQVCMHGQDSSPLTEFFVKYDNSRWPMAYFGQFLDNWSIYFYSLFGYFALQPREGYAFDWLTKIILRSGSAIFGILLLLDVWIVSIISIDFFNQGFIAGLGNQFVEYFVLGPQNLRSSIEPVIRLLVLIQAFRAFRAGDRYAIYIFLSAILTNFAGSFGWLASNMLNITYYDPRLLTLLQGLVMAFAVVSRNKEIADSLETATKTRQAFIEEQNRLLEDRVVQRTAELQAQTEKTEKLMLNILPKSIADRLKVGEESISDSHVDATILFSDLVGFTKMSAGKSAEELVFLLNDLFTRFDQRALSLGLEKIKTIGDAYMVAGGIPNHADDHAIQVVKMALGMYEDLEAFNAEHSMELGMRVGINSGPVVAGVIGHSKFSYDLWGNTVNTASRMESTSVAGKIQVSPSTHAQIRKHFKTEERELIECKGLGQIMTYFVTAPA